MSNWNKVNSEMYSLTDGPYHCIVRESGQMYYCEVFRNDDLIFLSTYEDVESAKIDCEIKVLADRFKAGLFSPIVFDLKDTGGKEDVIERHAQAAKAVEDGCKAATEQEPKYKWAMLTADYYHLSTDEFYVSVFTALDKWSLRITERSSNTIVINSALDECEDAKKMAELFLKGYYDEPEVKLTHEEPKYNWKEPRKNSLVCKVNEYRLQANLYHGQWWYTVSYVIASGNKGWRRSYMSDVNTKLGAQIAAEKELDNIISEQPNPTEPKTKSLEPFTVVEGWNIFVFRGRIPLSKKPTSWCFRAEKENSHATYCDFESENEAKAAALEWVRSFSYGCVDIEQPNPTEVEETVIAQIRKRRDVGREKYGTTMEREDLSFIQWLQHLQEELLDAAIYAEKLKRQHRKELLSSMVSDDENSGLYE